MGLINDFYKSDFFLQTLLYLAIPLSWTTDKLPNFFFTLRSLIPFR